MNGFPGWRKTEIRIYRFQSGNGRQRPFLFEQSGYDRLLYDFLKQDAGFFARGERNENELVTVFGGSGFIGRHLIKRLMDQGMIVRVAVRDVEFALFLKPLGNAGRIVPFPADITNKASVARAVQGAGMAVNLVGVLYERGGATFKRVHVEGARNIAEAAAEAGVKRLVQVSAMGADENGAAKYARTKAVGERAVLKAFPDAVVLRPSVFGPEDDFFNRFAFMAKPFMFFR